MTSDGCEICGDPKHPQAYACDRCRKILRRVEMRRDSLGKLRKPDREARKRALKEAWDPDARCFRCHYTTIELETDDHRDHRYLSLEHQTPGDETEIVVVGADESDEDGAGALTGLGRKRRLVGGRTVPAATRAAR